MSLCPREKLTRVRRNALCLGQWYNLFRIIAQNNCKQHTTIRSALERFVPACPVVGFGRPWFVVVVHDAIVESGGVLDVDCGGSCRSQGYLFGRFFRLRYVLTNHICRCIRIVTVFVENERHCSLIRSVGKMLSCRQTSCTLLILCRRAGGRHCAFAIVCPMSLSTASPPVTDVTVEQDICPCPYICFYLYLFPFSFPSKKKVSLCTRLYQFCTHFWIKITTTKLEGQPLRSNPQHAGETTTSKLEGGPEEPPGEAAENRALPVTTEFSCLLPLLPFMPVTLLSLAGNGWPRD